MFASQYFSSNSLILPLVFMLPYFSSNGFMPNWFSENTIQRHHVISRFLLNTYKPTALYYLIFTPQYFPLTSLPFYTFLTNTFFINRLLLNIFPSAALFYLTSASNSFLLTGLFISRLRLSTFLLIPYFITFSQFSPNNVLIVSHVCFSVFSY